jgi:hypothetical protein
VLPSKYFGANAACLRLAVITHNVLSALKRLALPAESLRARPKRLRFLIFNTPRRLAYHARKMVLRLVTRLEQLGEWMETWCFPCGPKGRFYQRIIKLLLITQEGA